MATVRLKKKWINGNPGSDFSRGGRRGDAFSFTSEDGERYDGVMMSNNKEVLNIPGGTRFEALFENPDSLKGERRTVTKELWEVTID